MHPYSLGKRHKLCAVRDIDRLFVRGQASTHSALAFPLRAVWVDSSPRPQGDPQCRFLVSVPKKRLRRAVDRVAVRRRVREAYRLNHGAFDACDNRPIDVAFIYVADRVRSSATIAAAMVKLLAEIHPSSASDDC